MIVWIGPKKLRVVAAPMPGTLFARKRRQNFVQNADALPGGLAIPRSERSRYFSVTISRIGPDVLGHAAVDQHQAVLQPLPHFRRGFVRIENLDAAAAAGRG